jgi:hypothetical protein
MRSVVASTSSRFKVKNEVDQRWLDGIVSCEFEMRIIHFGERGRSIYAFYVNVPFLFPLRHGRRVNALFDLLYTVMAI